MSYLVLLTGVVFFLLSTLAGVIVYALQKSMREEKFLQHSSQAVRLTRPERH